MEFEAAVREDSSNWTPPGKVVASYDTKDGVFELWKGSLADLAVQQLVSRIQIMVTLFIEGGTPIDLEEPDKGRWTVFFLYRKQPVHGTTDQFSYMFAGYCTVYRFFLYQPPTPPGTPSDTTAPAVKDDLDLGDGNFDLSTLPCRSRISQFIIIPSFQGKGHGPKFYSLIYQDYLKHPQTVEITVEDPNEAFDDLRDISDLAFLRTDPEFTALRLNTDLTLPGNGIVPRNLVDPEASEALRRKVKMAPRQFARVLEMHLMSTLPDSVRPGISPEQSASGKVTKEQEHEYTLWKLLVKKRIYRQNRDTLGQLDLPERIEKLEETRGSVEFEYARLLAMFETRQKQAAKQATTADQPNLKRPLEDVGEGSGPSKKARVEDA
jgi:histone acetyltransferase 1